MRARYESADAAAEADNRGHCCGRPELAPLKDAVPKRARGREHQGDGLLGEASQRDNEMRASAIDCSLVSSNASGSLSVWIKPWTTSSSGGGRSLPSPHARPEGKGHPDWHVTRIAFAVARSELSIRSRMIVLCCG